MNQNPLMNQNNIKYNPDVLSKYQTFKSYRSQGYTIPTNDKPQKVTVISNDGDMRKKIQEFNQTRNVQDQQIQRIFSNENRYKNKQMFDDRQTEIDKVTTLMSKGVGKLPHEMKTESQNTDAKYTQLKSNSLFEQLKDLIISYD
jgi:hypothetical protein